MRGRRPLPKTIKEQRGTLRIGRSKDSAIYDQLSSRVPNELDAVAAQEFRRIHKILSTAGILQVTDRAMLIAHCQSYSRWQAAESLIADEGLVLRTPVLDRHGAHLGYKTAKHPAVSIAQAERAACMRA